MHFCHDVNWMDSISMQSVQSLPLRLSLTSFMSIGGCVVLYEKSNLFFSVDFFAHIYRIFVQWWGQKKLDYWLQLWKPIIQMDFVSLSFVVARLSFKKRKQRCCSWTKCMGLIFLSQTFTFDTSKTSFSFSTHKLYINKVNQNVC